MAGNTLISPVLLRLRSDIALSARAGVESVEKRIFGEIAKCLTNEERRDFWVAMDEYVAQNLANIAGKIGGKAGVSGSNH
jgi:hypothetical protein